MLERFLAGRRGIRHCEASLARGREPICCPARTRDRLPRMKITLIHPPIYLNVHAMTALRPSVPLGLAYIAGVLWKARYDASDGSWRPTARMLCLARDPTRGS